MALVVAVGLVPASAAALPERVWKGQGSGRIVFILERVSSGPTSFVFGVTLRPGKRRAGGMADIDARVEKRRIVDVLGGLAVGFDPQNEPYVYNDGDVISTCDFGSCDTTCCEVATYTSEYRDQDGSGRLNRVFVAAEARRYFYSLRAKGWVLRTADWDFRFINGYQSKAVGVDDGSLQGAEVFMEATAPGGPHGSLAVAVAPCSGSISNVTSRGIGRARLDGGVESHEVTCPGDGDPPAGDYPGAASWATEATQWRFHGLVAGDTSLFRTRLFVLDLPPGPVP